MAHVKEIVAVAVIVLCFELVAGDGTNHSTAHAPAAQVLNASDISPDGPCKSSIAKFCGNIENGDARHANCIRAENLAARNRKESSPMTPSCNMDVSRFFFKAARLKNPIKNPFGKLLNPAHKRFAIDTVPGMRLACNKSAEKHCPEKTGFLLMSCLRMNKAVLDSECQQKVFQWQRNSAADMGLDVHFYDACKADLAKLSICTRSSPFSMNLARTAGQRKACLKQHKEDLSRGCHEELFRREQQDAEDIRLNLDVYKMCKAEISTKCKDKEFGEGRMMKCLWEKAFGTSKTSGFSTTCKKKVRELTIRSLQDYRLDYRVRTRCTHEIETSCAAEKKQVDAKSAAELFAKHSKNEYEYMDLDDSPSGLVLNCLKKNMTRLGDSCKDEMRRVIMVHSMHKRADPVFAHDCEEDISLLCADVEPDSYKIHICLRKHLSEISAPCKRAEIAQGTLEAMDIGLKPALGNRCRSAIAEHCSHVNPGEAQVIHCLQDNMNTPGFPPTCKSAVEDDLEASNRDWRLKYGFEAQCSKDIRALCKEEMEAEGGLGEVLSCLKDKYKKVQSEQCQEQILRVTRQGANNIKLAPNQYEVCKGDSEKYCAGVTPGSGRVHNCLLRNRFVLSEPCAAAEFKNRNRQSHDVRASPTAMIHCKMPMKELCGDFAPGGGKMWTCLEDKVEDPKMPQACKEIIKNHMHTKHLEYNLNPRLRQSCGADANALCKEDADVAAQNNFQSEGKLINCLIQNRQHVKNTDCVAMLERKAKQKNHAHQP
jgi:Golgi apparatus protein 1